MNLYLTTFRDGNADRIVVRGDAIALINHDTFLASNMQSHGWSESLKDVVEVIKKIDLNHIGKLNMEELNCLIKNYLWINKKIEIHNERVANSCIARTINACISILDVQTLDDEIITLYDYKAKLGQEKKRGEALIAEGAKKGSLNKNQQKQLIQFLENFELSEKAHRQFLSLWSHLPDNLRANNVVKSIFLRYSLEDAVKAIAELPEKSRIKYLMTADNEKLSAFFEKISFFEGVDLKKLTAEELEKMITPDFEKILERLVELKSPITLNKIQKTALFSETRLSYLREKVLRDKTIEELKNHLEAIDPENAPYSLPETISKLNKLNNYIPKEDLLKVLTFIRQYKTFIDGGEGVVSKTKPYIRKFSAAKFDIPLNVKKDMETGDLFIQLGFIGQGSYKIVKKGSFFHHRILMCKQPLNSQLVLFLVAKSKC